MAAVMVGMVGSYDICIQMNKANWWTNAGCNVRYSLYGGR